MSQYTNKDPYRGKPLKLDLGPALALLHNRVDQGTHASSYPDTHIIAVFEVDGRLLDEADALRRASHDDRAWLKCRALRKEGDCLANVKDHVTTRERIESVRETK